MKASSGFFIFLLLLNPFAIADSLFVSLQNGNSTYIYYESAGEGIPFVVFHRAKQPVLESVFEHVEGFKRYYIDPPGIGKSGSESWITSGDLCVDILSETITELIDSQNFFMCGFSYFGYQAQGVLSKFKNQVYGVVMICPVVIPDWNERNLEIDNSIFTDSEFFNNLADDDKVLLANLKVQNEESYNNIKKYRMNNVKMNSGFWEIIKNNNYSHSFSPLKTEEIFHTPVLLFAGLQDNIVGYKDAFKLAEYYKRMSVVLLDLASHELPFEQYEIFSRILMQWLIQRQSELKSD